MRQNYELAKSIQRKSVKCLHAMTMKHPPCPRLVYSDGTKELQIITHGRRTLTPAAAKHLCVCVCVCVSLSRALAGSSYEAQPFIPETLKREARRRKENPRSTDAAALVARDWLG